MNNPNDVRNDSTTDDDPETSEDELDDAPTQSHEREKRNSELPW